MNLVVGAKSTEYPGWFSTDLRSSDTPLDIREAGDWQRYFKPDSLDRIVCDHVLEHMTVEDGFKALANFQSYLKPGGFARIAVPDAFNPDWHYQEHCRPGGFGQLLSRLLLYASDEPLHLVHYDYRALSALVSCAGLAPTALEFFDERGIFHRRPWDNSAAPIQRFFNSPYNVNLFLPWHGFQNLSLIVDAVKPVAAVRRAA